MSNPKTIANEENKGIEIKEEKWNDKKELNILIEEIESLANCSWEYRQKKYRTLVKCYISNLLLSQRQELEAKLNKELPRGYAEYTAISAYHSGYNACLCEAKEAISRVFNEK